MYLRVLFGFTVEPNLNPTLPGHHVTLGHDAALGWSTLTSHVGSFVCHLIIIIIISMP